VKILTENPRDATHWSTRDMAKATGMSQPTVRRIWKTFGLKSWATDTFKLAENPFFIKQVRDVVGLCMYPVQYVPVETGPEFGPIVCLNRPDSKWEFLEDEVEEPNGALLA
jgi:hypothetical protein